jgi:glycosyltransferase involved in cell wall biosynthesis
MRLAHTQSGEPSPSTDADDESGPPPGHSRAIRILLVSEGRLGTWEAGIMGHLRLEQVLCDEAAAGSVIEVEVLNVPNPVGISRYLVREIPGLGRIDLDLQQLRWHAVHSILARRALAARVAAGPPFDALLIHTQAVSFGLRRWRPQRVPVFISADCGTRVWRDFDIWRSRSFGTRVTEILTEHFEREALAAADAVLAWSEWTRHTLPQTVTPVHVWHPGLERRWTGQSSARREWPPLLLFVGGRFAAKGGQLFLEAVRPLIATGAARAQIVTSDNVASEKGLEVTHLEPGDPRMTELLGQAHILVLPSKGEAVPWTVIEALSQGCVVVASDVGANLELVADAGYVGPLATAAGVRQVLSDLVTSPEQLAQLSIRASERGAHFQVERSVSRLVGIIEEVRAELVSRGEPSTRRSNPSLTSARLGMRSRLGPGSWKLGRQSERSREITPSRSSINVGFYSDAVEWAGAEIALGTLLAGLHEHVEATIIGVDEATVERLLAYRPNSRTVVLPAPKGVRDFRNIVRHRREIAALELDIFQANLTWSPACREAILAASTIPGLELLAVEHLPLDGPGMLSHIMTCFTARRLDAHVAVGMSAARSIEGRAKLPRNSVRTIYNGVVDHGSADDHRYASGSTVIGCLARLDHVKGLDLVLEALVDLPGATFVVAGRGNERVALEALAEKLGVAPRVKILEWVESPAQLMETFDVFVLPSRAEGFPLSILEAMLMGLPVVATDVGSVREAVQDGETGFVVRSGDVIGLTTALRQLIDQPELRQRLGTRARAVALERFSLAKMIESYESLYDEMLGGS